jgi:hypothetical protein
MHFHWKTWIQNQTEANLSKCRVKADWKLFKMQSEKHHILMQEFFFICQQKFLEKSFFFLN